MAIFGIIVNNEDLPKKYIGEVIERLGTTGDYVKNPFTASVHPFECKPKLKLKRIGYIFNIRPMFANYPMYAVGFLGFLLIIFPRVWIGIAALIFIPLTFFWTARFYYYCIKLTLKKKGYKGKVLFLNNKRIIQEVFFNGNE